MQPTIIPALSSSSRKLNSCVYFGIWRRICVINIFLGNFVIGSMSGSEPEILKVTEVISAGPSNIRSIDYSLSKWQRYYLHDISVYRLFKSCVKLMIQLTLSINLLIKCLILDVWKITGCNHQLDTACFVSLSWLHHSM